MEHFEAGVSVRRITYYALVRMALDVIDPEKLKQRLESSVAAKMAAAGWFCPETCRVPDFDVS